MDEQRLPLPISQRIIALQRYVENPQFLGSPNSKACLDVGLLFKGLLTECEQIPALQEALTDALGAVHTLCDVIDSNGPNDVREINQRSALKSIARAYEFATLNKIS